MKYRDKIFPKKTCRTRFGKIGAKQRTWKVDEIVWMSFKKKTVLMPNENKISVQKQPRWMIILITDIGSTGRGGVGRKK